MLEKYSNNDKVYKQQIPVVIDFIKVNDSFKYLYYVGDVITNPSFISILNIIQNLNEQLNKNLIIAKLWTLIVRLGVYKQIHVTGISYPYSYLSFIDLTADSKDSKDSKESEYDTIVKLSELAYENYDTYLQFLLAYYFANLGVKNILVNANMQLDDRCNKILFMHFNIGTYSNGQREFGHSCALIFETVNSDTVCEFYDPNGVTPPYDLGLLLPLLSLTFHKKITFVNLAKELNKKSGIQHASYWRAHAKNDIVHISDLCIFYTSYYISRRLHNPGRTEDTYLRFLTYYDRHSQLDLLNWCCRRLRECYAQNNIILYDELINQPRDVQYNKLQEYIAYISRYNLIDIVFSEIKSKLLKH